MNLNLKENVTMYKQNKTEQDKKLREHSCTTPTKKYMQYRQTWSYHPDSPCNLELEYTIERRIVDASG